MFREFSTVSLPEKEHELSLWGELKRICKGLHSELCAGQPLTAWNQLLCSKKARESSQGSLTSPAGGLKCSAPWKSRRKGVGWAAAPRNVPSEETLPHMPGLLLSTWSLRSFCLPVACGPSRSWRTNLCTNLKKNLTLAAHVIPQNIPKNCWTCLTQVGTGWNRQDVSGEERKQGPFLDTVESNRNAGAHSYTESPQTERQKRPYSKPALSLPPTLPQHIQGNTTVASSLWRQKSRRLGFLF